MAISNMQQARQLRAGGGIMAIPRQKYGFGSFVKKAFKKVASPIKKIAKSPLGKAALIGGGLYLGGGGGNPFTTLGRGKFGSNAFGSFLKDKVLGSVKTSGPAEKGFGVRTGGLRGLFSKINPFSSQNDLTFGQRALIGGGLAATALPFFMGGGEDEGEIVGDEFDITPSSITDIVSQAKRRDPSLRFLPQNAYTQQGFFGAADGGIARTGYAMGGPTEDVMVENVDTQEVVSNPDPMAELNMLAIELFGKRLDQLNETERGQLQELIQSRMQEQDQNRVMANSGGMMDYMSSANPMADSYLMEDTDIVNMYRPGGDRQMAAEGGIMDLGGMEKDYREEGGFVPIGGEEKADDVPARLSKNEFVFTADAVRNAGGGDIDRGAEVMENLMNNLEQGGEVSEESQGMNPAQEMFDTAQMLEGRIA
jgi:hypothetical protein